MATRKLQVEIVGDASSLQKALGNATDHSSRLGSALKTLGKVAAVGAGAAFAGLAVAVKNGFDELSEGQKVSAQTEARLKSTGQAANVTAKDIESLAQAQSRLTGIDDEAVQAGENMLLTFTNIRNEVGKGNDIFNQSTIAVENMATAMADGAVPSAEQLSKTAIRVGKALNDPIKGMGALSRVGVQFDADQQKMIKTLVKAGDTMGAQKYILAELTKEFGGSAKAAGDTLPGQLAKARNAFDEVSAQLATKLLPILTEFLQWVNAHWPEISAVFDAVGSAIVTAFDGIAAVVSAVRGQIDSVKQAGQGLFAFYEKNQTVFIVSAAAIGSVMAFAEAYAVLRAAITAATAAQAALNIATLTNPYVAVAAAVVALAGALTALYFSSDRARKVMNDTFNDLRAAAQTILPYIQGAWQRFGASFVAIGEAIFKTVTLGFRNMLDALRGIVNVFAGVFTGDWRRVWQGVTQLFNAMIGNLLQVVLAWAGALRTAATQAGAALLEGIRSQIGKIPGAVEAAGAAAAAAAVRVGQAIIGGVLDGLAGLYNAVKNKVEGILRSVLGALNPFSPVEEGGARYIGEPIVRGAIMGLERLEASFTAKTTDVVRNAVTKAADAVREGRSQFAAAWEGYSSAALAVFDKIASQVQTKSEIALEKLRTAREQAGIKEGVQTAQAGLAQAQATGDAEQILAAQKALDDALYRQKEYALTQRAEQERAAFDLQTETNRVRFENWLTTRTLQQQQELAKEGAGQAAIIAKIKSYNPAYKQRGIEIGAALAAGLLDMRGAVRDAAQALASEISNALGVASQAAKTSTDTTVNLAAGQRTRRSGLAEGGVVTRPTLTWIGERGPEAVIPLSQMGGAGPTYVFQFPNYVGSRDDLIAEVRRGLYEVSRRNPGAIPGAA